MKKERRSTSEMCLHRLDMQYTDHGISSLDLMDWWIDHEDYIRDCIQYANSHGKDSIKRKTDRASAHRKKDKQ